MELLKKTEVITKPVDIVLEAALLSALSSKANYELYHDSLNPKRFSDSTNIMLQAYDKYFAECAHDVIDWGVFLLKFSEKWHRDFSETDIEYYRSQVIPKVQTVSDVDTNSAIADIIYKQTGEDIIKHVNSGNAISAITDIVDNYESLRSQFVTTSDTECFTIDELDFAVLDKSLGIPYFLPSLQAGLGGMTKGQFVVIAADSNVGKSAFVIGQAVRAFVGLHETKNDRPILYFNSEGTLEDVQVRFLSYLYAKQYPGGFEDVFANIDAIKDDYKETYNTKNFKLLPLVGSGLGFIQKKIKMYNPSLVIIDILDTLAKEEDASSLKKLYDGLRLLSNQTCPIIGTTQAGDQSYLDRETNEKKNRQWLDSKSLYGSKTGKSGAADTMIMIGRDSNPQSTLRYICTTKKKRGKDVKLTCELVDIYSQFLEI